MIDDTPRQARRHGLSKSKLTSFEQCPRRLWLQVHAPDRADLDEEQEAWMAAGHTVGEVACSLCPGGVMVEAEEGLGAALEQTRRLLADDHPGPIFEATFEHDGVLIRADILSRDGAGGWHLAEVEEQHRGQGLSPRRSRDPGLGAQERRCEARQRGGTPHRQPLRARARGGL